MKTRFDELTTKYMEMMDDELGQVEWELIEELCDKNKDINEEDSIKLFESVFIPVSELEPKELCNDCDENTYEQNTHENTENIKMKTKFSQLTNQYMEILDDELGEVEYELIEELCNKNKDINEEDSIKLFESVFIPISELESKYICGDCDEVFYEHNCHKNHTEDLLCPNCESESLSRADIREDVSESYIKTNP